MESELLSLLSIGPTSQEVLSNSSLASSAPSERVFSKMNVVINKRRGKLLPERAERIIFLKMNAKLLEISQPTKRRVSLFVVNKFYCAQPLGMAAIRYSSPILARWTIPVS